MYRFGFPVVAFLASMALAEDPFVPFEMDWTAPAGLVDLSDFLDRPAGKDGFVAIRDGRIYTPTGKRLRIWGVNLTAGACFPEKDDAPKVADHLARFGVNAVRFHFLDSNWGPGKSLFPAGDSTRTLDPAQLDRLDWFVHQLKLRGIYSNFNLNVGRVFRSSDGVTDHGCLGLGKAVTIFDPHVINLQKEYASQLLTHRNPYTDAEYRSEPALAIVELVNENSLVEAWFSGRLVGRDPAPTSDTWAGVTHAYARQLDGRYNDWLKQKLAPDALAAIRKAAAVADDQPLPRLLPDEFDKADASRFAAEARFYMEVEDSFFQQMYRFLKDDLKARQLVVATSDHNHWKTGYPLLASASKLDIVDGHVYWQHPSTRTDPGTGRRQSYIPNTPMTDDPLHSTVVQLARSAVAGKPYTVSETNHPFPNEYACEGIPILAAYALLHDWDGIFFYTFEHEDPAQWKTRTPGNFDIAPDPVKMVGLAAAAAMFHRADVRPAERSIDRSYSPAQIVESLRLPSTANQPLFTPGFPSSAALIHGSRIASFDTPAPAYPAIETPNPIASDTGQLQWHHGKADGLVTVSTPRTQALIGHLAKSKSPLPNLSARLDTPFGAIILTSLDGLPLDRSNRMLLAATARSALTGMKRNDERTSLIDWGKRPMRIEPVAGTVLLTNRANAADLEVVALDPAAQPIAQPLRISPKDGAYAIPLNHPTAWYLIRTP